MLLGRYTVQKYKDIQNYNFAFCFVWVLNLVSHTEGRTLSEGVREERDEQECGQPEGTR
jgi:hypothetical protein